MFKKLLVGALFVLFSVFLAHTVLAADSTTTSIHGGADFDTAVTITPGIYNLDHNQISGNFDYFKLHVDKGVTVNLKVVTATSGVLYNPKTKTFGTLTPDRTWFYKANEWNYSASICGGLIVEDSDRTITGQVDVNHASSKGTHMFSSDRSADYYILVGCPTAWGTRRDVSVSDMSKNVAFSITEDAPVVATSTPTQNSVSDSNNVAFNNTPKNIDDSTEVPSFWNYLTPSIVVVVLVFFSGLVVSMVIKSVVRRRVASAIRNQIPLYNQIPTPVQPVTSFIPPTPPTPPTVPPTTTPQV